MAKPLGWCIFFDDGRPWADDAGRMLVMPATVDKDAWIAKLPAGSRAVDLIRWTAPRKPRHEYGTDNKGER